MPYFRVQQRELTEEEQREKAEGQAVVKLSVVEPEMGFYFKSIDCGRGVKRRNFVKECCPKGTVRKRAQVRKKSFFAYKADHTLSFSWGKSTILYRILLK